MMESQASLQVATTDGVVADCIQDGLVAFRGIPYAAAPFGSRRFKGPQRPMKWDGCRDAKTFGLVAPQPRTVPFIGDTQEVPPVPPWSEDCLSLNVITPDIDESGLPVLVYFHGGSYVVGSGGNALCEPAALAREGAVGVSINYRLGIDGFLALPGAASNLGLRDQLAALRWVQENIHRFGGDPSNVTVFGSSSGGGSIAAIAIAAAAEGLLHRVILQSAPLRLMYDDAEAREVAARVLDDMGVGTALAQIPLAELMTRLSSTNERFRDSELWHPYSYRLTPFVPVVDGEVVHTQSLYDMIPDSVDLLVGCTTDEGRSFLVPMGLLESADENELAIAQDQYAVPAACRSAINDLDSDQSQGVRLANLITDQMYRGPAVELALGHAARGGRTYSYDFAWSLQQEGGAPHGMDYPFVFDLLGEPAAAPMMGSDPPKELGDFMRKAWVSFARSGDPGWPRYEEKERTVMVLDRVSRAQRDPREERRPAWDASVTTDQQTGWVSAGQGGPHD